MSIKMMSAVWSDSPQEGGTLLVLLALADFADDDGKCWPNNETLAAKARLSKRQVNRVLAILNEAGEIVLPPGDTRHVGRENPIVISPILVETKCLDGTPASRDQDAGVPISRERVLDAVFESSEEPSLDAAEGKLFEAPSDRVQLATHWTLRSGRELKLGDAKVKRVLDGALKARPLDQCKLAIDGLFADPWWKQNVQTLELRHALRGNSAKAESDADRIDKMAAKAGSSNGPTPVAALIAHMPSDAHAYIRNLMRNVSDAYKLDRRDESAEIKLRDRVGIEPILEEAASEAFPTGTVKRVSGWKRVAR